MKKFLLIALLLIALLFIASPSIAHGPPAFPQQDFFKTLEADRFYTTDSHFVDEMWNGIDSAWATRVTTGSAAVQSRTNGWYRLTTGATATNEESLDWNDILTFVNTQRPTFEIRLDLEEISKTEVEAGLIEVSGGADDDYIRVYFDASVGTPWNLQACTAGTCTSDAGADADTNEILLKVIFTSDTALEWFVNNVSQGTVTTNVPTAALQAYVEIRTEENSAHYVDIDFVKIWQDRN